MYFDLNHEESVGYMLREVRSAKKLSMKKVAEKSGIKYQTMRRIETITTNPHVSDMIKIFRGMGYDVFLELRPRQDDKSDKRERETDSTTE